MKAILSMILALVPVLTWGALCDDTYYLQSITQTILSGANPKDMSTRQVKTVSPDLSELTSLHAAMTYTVLVGFDGACVKALKPVRYKVKAASKTVFTDSTDGNYQVQLYDTNTRVEDFNLAYWFGFYKPATTLNFFLGMKNTSDNTFSNYYAAVLYSDSTRDPSSGLWTRSTSHFYNLSGPSDSVSLDKGMLDGTKVRDIVVDDNHKGYFSIQFLKVVYSNQKPSSLQTLKRPSAKFQTSQSGNLVIIQPSNGKATISEPLSLYGMMGNKIATLHATGYAYQWNGKTAMGTDAPGGVYFVQAGNRTLGKFFYSR
jgi:hypothetical protein